ncbi:MAG: DUF429 domain-containing protein [Actinomycetota bacterium]
MLTLGVDLASQPSKTAACSIEWDGGRATVRDLLLGLTDDDLLALISRSDKVGIDSPFGWPAAFVKAVAAHSSSGRWPDENLLELRYRYTDRVVTEKARRPLSVSSDLIAVTAMRCARILSALDERGEPVDRAGSGRVVEVYPAAALAVWGFEPAGYKRSVGLEKRRVLIDALRHASRGWLSLSEVVVESCVRSDDCLDALVASLAARAAALGLTVPPPEEKWEQARHEGWIHLPLPESFAALARERVKRRD